MDIVLSRILKLKSDKKISDAQFAKDLHFYSSIVSEWKNGSSKSYMKHLPKIANYFETTVDAILNGETDEPKQKTPPIDIDRERSEEMKEIMRLYDAASPQVRKAALALLESFVNSKDDQDRTDS